MVGGAVELFDVLGDHVGVDLGDTIGQVFLFHGGFGVVHDQIDRHLFSDNGCLSGMLVRQFIPATAPL